MKKYSKLIIGAILVFILVVFSAINTNHVRVNFGFTTLSSPLIFVILGSTLLGCVIVLLFFFSNSWQQRRELKRLRGLQADHEERLASALASKDEELAALREKFEDLNSQMDELKEPVLLEQDEVEILDHDEIK